MHMFSNGSNANAAARKMIANYPDRLTLAAPQRAPGVTPMFYAGVAKVKGAVFTDEEVATITAKMRLLEADAAEDTDSQQAELNAKAKKAAPKAKAKKAGKQVAPKKKETKRVSKTDQALKLIGRANGATNQELQDAFDWQPHSVRGFISHYNTAHPGTIVTVQETGKPSRYTLAK